VNDVDATRSDCSATCTQIARVWESDVGLGTTHCVVVVRNNTVD